MTSTQADSSNRAPSGRAGQPPTWTYPTRTCRLCLEDVPATVTLWPPGLPPALQRPIVEYKSDDGYGRLVKPCLCRGGMRYIHELCLKRSRTEVPRPGSLWKCHQCGYQFNFNRLAVQKFLGSNAASGILTVLLMVFVMFLLGFVADPIINFYAEPYEAFLGREDVWQEVDLNESKGRLSGWAQHFMKGLVSMGVLSFLRTMILNPLNWWSIRTGMINSRVGGRSTTGRDRAVNVSWIVILMGVLSASYFFYKTVQAIIGKILQHIGNNIVDTQLPGDDEDIKPPPGFNFGADSSDPDNSRSSVPNRDDPSQTEGDKAMPAENKDGQEDREGGRGQGHAAKAPVHPGTGKGSAGLDSAGSERSMPGTFHSNSGYSSALDDARSQGWSF